MPLMRVRAREKAKETVLTDETQGDFAEAWRPEPGDTITGTMIGVEVINPGDNGPYPCLTLKTSLGEVRNIHAFHQVLRNGIARRRPKIGDELTITYRGKKEGGAFGGYHDYVVFGGQPVEMNWDSWLPEDERTRVLSAEPPIASAPIPAHANPAAPPAEEFLPLPKPPSTQEKAGQFGEAPPF